MRADFEFDKESYPYAAAIIGVNTAKVWHVPTLSYVMGEAVPTRVAEAHAKLLNAKLRALAKQGVSFTVGEAHAAAYNTLNEALESVAALHPLRGTETIAVVKAQEQLKPN